MRMLVRLNKSMRADTCIRALAFCHASRGHSQYILDQFPIVRRKDEERFGEYRTKRVILELYDAMQDARRTGKPFRTPAEAK
jgi:hypothetical protein